MDWARVKSILIIVFLIVNIFLVMKIIDKSNRKELRSDEIQSVTQLLNNNNIVMQVQIPTQIFYMPRIRVNNETAEEGALADRLLGPGQWTNKSSQQGSGFYLSNGREMTIKPDGTVIYKIKESGEVSKEQISQEWARSRLNSLLEKYVSLQSYHFESISKTEDGYEITMKNVYKETEIFNNRIKAKISNSGEITISQGLVSFAGFAGKPRKVAATDAMVELIRYVNINEKTVVRSISIGYYADFNKNGEIIRYGEADPAWKVETDKGTFIFDGYNGTMLYQEGV